MLIVPTNIWQVSRMTLKAFLPPHNYTPSNAYRHMDTLEYQVTFMSSHAYRHVLSPNRRGRPRPHWAESCLTEASHRISYMQSDDPPRHSDINNAFFSIPSLRQICAAHGSSNLVVMDNTPLYRTVPPYSQNRENWRRLVHKPSPKRHA